MNTAIVYVLASIGEIAGCFSFWAWLRLGKSPLWLLPGMASLALFAYLLTRIDTPTAGRAYAAYGSIYIVSSICWLWARRGLEGARPDRWDVVGASVAIVGAGIILFGIRS
jgi:small multidrug resistance family-3 protein